MDNSSLPVALDRILEEARLKVSMAEKHLTQLSQFGLDQEWINQMKEEINQIADIPTFDAQKIQLKELTSEKNSKLEACQDWGKTLRLRIKLATKDKKLKGVEFPTSQWNEAQISEAKLITLFPTLIDLAKKHSKVLETFGQTDDIIQQAETYLTELVKADQAQEEYNIQRRSETVDRQDLYRSLYDKVNRINEIGQMVFADTPNLLVLFDSNWKQRSTSHSSDKDESEAANSEQ
ncbi:MAG: hypothetical protein AB4041_12505 [Microcystaceae cyanobacterium]